MRILIYPGLILLLGAFFTTAAEVAVHGVPGGPKGFFVSAHDLWYTFWPESLLIFEIRVERYLATWVWDPLLYSMLQLPGWVILGLPGMALVILGRWKRGSDEDDGVSEMINQFELFDELNRQALAENPPGEEHGPRDMLPDHLEGEDLAIDASRPDDFDPDPNPFGQTGTEK